MNEQSNLSTLIYPLSFYSPLIVSFAVFALTIFTSTLDKSFVYFLWIFVITFIRILVLKGINYDKIVTQINPICLTGLSEIIVPKDTCFSIYLLSFTLVYFVLPMVLISVQNNVNAVNYGVIGFFLTYLGLDIFVKFSLYCVPNYKHLLANVCGGIFLGALISGIIMYGTQLKKYLFINNINSDKQICTQPSKQQFKCKVYKDGTLIGNI